MSESQAIGLKAPEDGEQVREICRAHDHQLPSARREPAESIPEQMRELAALRQRNQLLESELESRKQLETALREALERRRSTEQALRQSNRDLDQFALVASHDLKAPLRGISNLAQWIEDDLNGQMTPASREQMGLLRDRVRKMEALIDAILNYSGVGRDVPQLEEVDVGQLVGEVIELIQPAAKVKLTVAAMPTFVTERARLYQVFQNLLSNAVKYTQRPDPSIAVRVVEEGEFFHFSVEDNGPGIAPKFHELIWQVFARVESTNAVEGTGIGLSVVRKITELQGGKVWLNSTSGAGSVFHFLWPRRSPHRAEATPSL